MASVPWRVKTSEIVPPPGGGAIGVLATSVLMSVMYFATTFCASDRLGVTAVSISEFGGMPRSALSILAAAWSLANQLIQATAASGFFVLADADHSMLALYQAFRSVAWPVRLGARSILISSPDAALIASSWLVLEVCMAAFPTTSALWSSGLAEGPCPSSLICWAVPMAFAFSNLTIIS